LYKESALPLVIPAATIPSIGSVSSVWSRPLFSGLARFRPSGPAARIARGAPNRTFTPPLFTPFRHFASQQAPPLSAEGRSPELSLPRLSSVSRLNPTAQRSVLFKWPRDDRVGRVHVSEQTRRRCTRSYIATEVHGRKIKRQTNLNKSRIWLATEFRLKNSRSPVEELKTDPADPRRHSKKQIRQIAASIETFGFNVPILIDRDGNVVAGHGRLLAVRELG
jgi:hypothetical protein